MTDADQRTAEARVPPAPRWITRPVSVAVIAVAAVGVALSLRGVPAPVVAGAAAALAVAACGTAALMSGRLPDSAELAVLITIGLAGASLGGLLPATPGFVIVYLSLAGLGMSLPPRTALPAALVVFAAMNVAIVQGGKAALAGLVSQAIGAAFVFSVGAFVRSSQLERERAHAAQARAEELLEQLRASQAAQAQAAALAERARLAREIHDVLAHALTGLVLALDTIELLSAQAAGGQSAAQRMAEQVGRAQRMARDGLADTKRAIAALRGDELPGPALLDRLVRETAQATGVRAELCVQGNARTVSPEIGLTLYRTAQEALTNTVRHAGPGAQVGLLLAYEDSEVELSVDDVRARAGPAAVDGMPPDAAATVATTPGGYGLTGMRERAELMGGSLIAGPTAGGFAVRLRLPDAGQPGAR